ncbi:LOW QUALITY PROTEIN: hypothetical protein RJ639_018163 [Escallonia herrerae]|uniref:50S ribosomal protein L1 n=1 Tax=Escallonia herrerae TaxID=1293975 RepID=A0AA88V9G4_9ASTE|nr:LOW QUALITY PROTEIN: hypothetical protein RJ639_018163 [Escallonia herrerae]
MAALKLLLSQARSHCLTRTPSPNPSLLGFYRSLCSSPPDSESNPQTPPTEQPPPKPQPTLIQRVSYAVMANRPTPPPRKLDPPQNPEARNFAREELRFMKDLPLVSYNTKVAPLPEDIVADNVGVKSERGAFGDDVELERERRRIEADKNRAMRRMPRALEEESSNVPFPTLIKLDKKGDEVVYDLKEAIRLVQVNAKHEFETVEAHVRLTLQLRRSDLKVKGTAALPHCVGKARVAVFAEGAAADEAKAAGADVVGGQELLEEIQKKNEKVKGKKGKIKVDFDICIATPQFMSGKWEKDGTVTNDLSWAVREAKGKVIFKKDQTAIVHIWLGKVTLPEEALRDNVGAFVNALLLAKPPGLKKSSKYVGYVNAFHICSTIATAECKREDIVTISPGLL